MRAPSKLLNLVTEPDNVTLCPVRIVVGLGVVVYHAAALYGLWTGAIAAEMRDLSLYVQHISTFAGIGGLSIGGKSLMKGDALHE